ncbi:DNA-primase RepB domain-containing protein [Mesorhizobium yinganensis]|uniref:DNA-primase RepB domain-containing protein n=1 Tax=Mesorhizobium yinganensis TaxID=3157707 RepID=UPI0032B7A05F
MSIHEKPLDLDFDIEEARQFLNALDPDACNFTFQTFDDVMSADGKKRGNKRLATVLHGSLDQHVETLKDLNRKGAGIFVTVNETNGEGRTSADIIRVRAVFVDLDGAPLEPVERYVCTPHIIVGTSEGKWHAYWRVEGMALDEFGGVQAALIKLFNADKTVTDLPRVMRLPGFYHKKGPPQRVSIYKQWALANYDAQQFRRLVPATNLPQPRGDSPEPVSQAVIDDARALLVQHWPENGSKLRHAAAGALGGFFGRIGGEAAEGAPTLIRSIAERAGDDEVDDRVRAVRDAIANLNKPSAKVPGLPKMREIFGDKVANQIAEWFGVSTQSLLEEMNAEYFVIELGGEVVVGTFKVDATGGRNLVHYSFGAFKNLHDHIRLVAARESLPAREVGG